MPEEKKTATTGDQAKAPTKYDEVVRPTESVLPTAPDVPDAVAKAPMPKGEDKPKFVVYLGGDPFYPPSKDPSGLWSQREWDERDTEVGFYRVDESGKLID